MARIEIESAFVEPWTKSSDDHPAWGMKTAEPHSRKKETGEGYETVGRTFRTVKVSRASGIDLTQFRKGDRVQVWGKEVTETREHEGKKYYDLVLWADRVERAGSGPVAPSSPVRAADEPWATSTVPNSADSDVWNTPNYGDETPF